MVHLASLIEAGSGISVDSARAAALYARALPGLREGAERGDSEAALELGELYAWGKSVPEDQEEANVWYRRAAEGGRPRALYLLGYRVSYGTGVDPDPAKKDILRDWAVAGAKQPC